MPTSEPILARRVLNHIEAHPGLCCVDPGFWASDDEDEDNEDDE
jgi:hypothetical protein